MKYVSTRSQTDLGSFCDVLLSGLAPDGGWRCPLSSRPSARRSWRPCAA
ncbi:hypothetical protein MSS93_14935 [Deinococcus radiodurans]|nr:hypothetical protein MSS93_14935 [Deinococcus radiodurans]